MANRTRPTAGKLKTSPGSSSEPARVGPKPAPPKGGKGPGKGGLTVSNPGPGKNRLGPACC